MTDNTDTDFWVSPALANYGKPRTAELEVREPLPAAPAIPGLPPATASLSPGEVVLGYSESLLREYARFPSQAARDAAVLWAAHTHMRDASKNLLCNATPRLLFLSSEPESGKSRASRLVGMLSAEFHGLDLEPTEAGIIWSLTKEHATLFLDEGDILFGKGQRKASIRSILNGGYERGGTHLKMRGLAGERVDCFGPVCVAGLDVMEKDTGDNMKAFFTRCIRIRMHASEDAVRPIDDSADAVAELLRGYMAEWVSIVCLDLKAPTMPSGVRNRAAQVWTPLLQLAEAAGGPWPERARKAAEESVRKGYLDTSPLLATQDERLSQLAGLTANWRR